MKIYYNFMYRIKLPAHFFLYIGGLISRQLIHVFIEKYQTKYAFP